MKELIELEQLQRQSIRRILGWAYKVLPLAYVLIIGVRIVTGHWEIVFYISLAAIINLVAYQLLKNDKIETSTSVFIVSLIILVTILCSLNNGIHDIGIVAYPAILLLSSLTLRLWQQAISFILIFLSITWLAMGEAWGFYEPSKVSASTTAEFIIMVVVIVMSALICYRIASQLKKMVIRTDKEVRRRIESTDELQHSLEQKIKLTSAVHAQVADSIATIRELHEANNEKLLPTLPSQLLTIEIIHSELHRLGIERELPLDMYLNALFIRQNVLFEGLSKHVDPDLSVNVDQAMAIGLFLNEIAGQQPLTGSFKGSLNQHEISLVITSDLPLKPLTSLAEIMVRQLIATASVATNSITLRFSSKTH